MEVWKIIFLSKGDDMKKAFLGGGNSNIFFKANYLGKISHFDSYFSDGLKPPTRVIFDLENISRC